MCSLQKHCRFVFYSARAFIWGITWPSTTSISFLYLYSSCLARIIGKTRPRPRLFWDPRPRWNTGPGRAMLPSPILYRSLTWGLGTKKHIVKSANRLEINKITWLLCLLLKKKLWAIFCRLVQVWGVSSMSQYFACPTDFSKLRKKFSLLHNTLSILA